MRREAYPLTASDYRSLIDELHTNDELRERAPVGARMSIELMLLGGLRIGESLEVCGSWTDVGPDGSVVRIPSAVNGEGWSPKTEAGSRVVPIAESFNCHATGETVEVETSSMLQSFFEVTDSLGVSKECVRRWLMYFARAADIDRPDIERTFNREPETLPDVIAHDCRASWCAQCLRSDVNRYTVRDWGGWSDMSMINRYAKFVGDPSGRQIAKF